MSRNRRNSREMPEDLRQAGRAIVAAVRLELDDPAAYTWLRKPENLAEMELFAGIALRDATRARVTRAAPAAPTSKAPAAPAAPAARSAGTSEWYGQEALDDAGHNARMIRAFAKPFGKGLDRWDRNWSWFDQYVRDSRELSAMYDQMVDHFARDISEGAAKDYESAPTEIKRAVQRMFAERDTGSFSDLTAPLKRMLAVSYFADQTDSDRSIAAGVPSGYPMNSAALFHADGYYMYGPRLILSPEDLASYDGSSSPDYTYRLGRNWTHMRPSETVTRQELASVRIKSLRVATRLVEATGFPLSSPAPGTAQAFSDAVELTTPQEVEQFMRKLWAMRKTAKAWSGLKFWLSTEDKPGQAMNPFFLAFFQKKYNEFLLYQERDSSLDPVYMLPLGEDWVDLNKPANFFKHPPSQFGLIMPVKFTG